jgi:hypothetical protein
MLAYLDCYWIFGVITALMLVVSLCIKSNKPGAGKPVPAH